MTQPTTPTGQRLLIPGTDRFRDVLRAGDILAIEQEAARQERERLRALHRTWDGHPSVGFSCGVCEVLLADPSGTPSGTQDDWHTTLDGDHEATSERG